MKSEIIQFLPIVAAACFGICVAISLKFLSNYLDDLQSRNKRSRLLSSYASHSVPGSLPKFKRYLNSQTRFDNIGRSLIQGKYEKLLKNLLKNTGDSDVGTYSALIRHKMTSTVLGIILGISLFTVLGSLVPLIGIVPFAFFLPDLLLKNRVLKRKQEIADLLPNAIDMLQMCVSAGLAFPAAMAKVAETQKGPVAEEFARVTSEVQLGQSRVDALRAMAERIQEPHISKFVSSMSQVDSFGIPISNVLQEQSKQMRAIRRERAREKGQKVPIKLLAPIMLCFLPCVMVIILGPAVLSIVRTFPS